MVLGSWIFGGLLLLLFSALVAAGPREIPAHKDRILGLLAAILAGLFGFFFTGSVFLDGSGVVHSAELTVQIGGGALLFLLTLAWWSSPFQPLTHGQSHRLLKAFAEFRGMRVGCTIVLVLFAGTALVVVSSFFQPGESALWEANPGAGEAIEETAEELEEDEEPDDDVHWDD